jgi:hypothetical protein
MTKNTPVAVGRAKTALVFTTGGKREAVVATLCARVRQEPSDCRLTYRGPASFAPDVVKHHLEVVLAAVDAVLRFLGIAPMAFEVSIVNLGVASLADVGMTVSGFSADLALFLALVSVALGIGLPQDVVFTGHIASPEGDIRPVSGIQEKLPAAFLDPSVKHVICPALDADTSLKTLAPGQREEAADAIARARQKIKVTEVTGVGQVVPVLLPDEEIALAALRWGFLEAPSDAPVCELGGTPVQEAAKFLAQGNDLRFWRSLEARLMVGKTMEARRLLAARVQYQVRRKDYPQDIGFQLLQLVRSVPRVTMNPTRRLPLLAMGQCLEFCRLGHEGDPDIQYFMEAVLRWDTGRHGAGDRPVVPAAVAASARAVVEAVCERLSAEALAKEVGLPIDSARAAYVIASAVVESNGEFHEGITAFYLFMVRRTELVPVSVDAEAVAKDALALLDHAFRDRGGVEAAEAEARCPVRGGMRFVLDVMTEQYKAEQQMKHASRLVREAIDPLDRKASVAFTAALLERLGPHLSPELRSLPAAQVARHVEQVLHTYVRSLDQVQELLRRL